MKVYQAMYCENVWESCFATISVHHTREGAEAAIKEHEQNELEEWRERYPDPSTEPMSMYDMKNWAIREVDVLP